MRIDFLAGRAYGGGMTLSRPRILVFDSGLGGLTVFAELAKARPDAEFIYAADDAAFPYGALDVPALEARVALVMERLIAAHRPDLVVIACNTASTLVLPGLRARFPIPFVGTVPAVKPAAAMSRSGVIAILATPGTVSRDYTQGLVRDYAGHCRHVALVGAGRLAAQAEAHLRGEATDEAVIAAEIAPCFVEIEGARTDVVALSCTHFPLLTPVLERLAPWKVAFVDPAPAIARRVTDLIGPARDPATAGVAWRFVSTGGQGIPAALLATLAQRGLGQSEPMPMPLVR
jgi:glutamate racemase